MPSDSKVAKKPYSSPSLVTLDASTVKAKLEADGRPKDAVALKMLSFIDAQASRRKPKSQS